MAKLVTVSEMRAIEQAADGAGLTYAQMMENAGESLAAAVTTHCHGRDKSILGLVGPGNNGGDTLVALAHLAKTGRKASALIVGERKRDKYLARAKKAGLTVLPSLAAATRRLGRVDVLLDGLLGTGIRLPLRAPFAETLSAINKAIVVRTKRPFIVAVDCPSGMDCDTGEVPPDVLRADLTVTMAAAKRGMLSLPAFEYIGELRVGNIGLPTDLPAWAAIRKTAIDESVVRAMLPERPMDAHKGTFGTALIVAGSQHFPGAALLAGEAAYRSGAGLVTIAAPESIQPALAGHLQEATWLPLPDEKGWISEVAAETLVHNMERVTAMLLGPGFGQQETTKRFLERILGPILPPLVLDADAIKLIAALPDWPKRLPPNSILTPHPGEMAVLTNLSIEEIQKDRIGTAERFTTLWGHVVVLKGAFTVVSSPDGRTAVNPLATPALARAGTGDVLAGLIASLRAQGVSAFEAACAGVWLHGQAGLLAAKRLGSTASVIAGDLIAEISSLIVK
ncbi:MAG: NAD(P)H-hydrate dehydratase [Anaerolineales bacterium]